MNKNLLNIERLVGKIDNDFNPDNSDWIPRIGAWVIDGLSQLKCLPKELKKRKVQIIDNIGVLSCPIDANSLKVFDEYGCEIPEAKNTKCCGDKTNYIPEQIGVSQVSDDVKERVIVANIINPSNRNYVITGGNKIEINFEADYIFIESLEVVQYFSEVYNCDLPYIFDDGILLEALSFYCMYKMLGRGYKHPVFSLSGQEPVNPYIQWQRLKSNASASVKIAMRKHSNDEGWNNFFFNSTFLPRNR
jgi:hypothetical protein